jgi:hypothetical protein
MANLMALLAAVVVIAATSAQFAEAQTSGREDVAALAVAGVVRTSAVFGDDDPRRTHGSGVSLGLQVRGPRAGRSAWVFEAALQTDPVQNPHFAESFAPVQVQFGRQIGRRLFVRPSGGIVLQAGSVAPLAGVAVGWEHQFRNGLISAPEFVVRAGGAVGIAGWMAGFQVPIGCHVRP